MYQHKFLRQLLALQKADFCSKGVKGKSPLFEEAEALIAEILAENACLSIKDLAVNGHDMMALGITGTQIGVALNTLLDAVLDGQLPNEKDALLAAAKKI